MSWRSPIAVGLVVVIGIASLTWFIVTTGGGRFTGRGTYILYGDFSDASGLREKTRVQISGIDVGIIDDIEHARGDDGRLVARVGIRIRDDYDIFDNAILSKKP